MKFLFKNSKKTSLSIVLLIILLTLPSLQQQSQQSLNYENFSNTANHISHLNLIEQLQIKISDQNGNILYPFSSKQKQQVLECGAIPSVKFKNQKILFVESMMPFDVMVSSKDGGDVRMSGLGESVKSQESGNYISMIFVIRQCNNYFSSQKFTTVFKIYPKKVYYNRIVQQLDQQFPIIIEISSLTYCLEQFELVSLQIAFNIGFITFWSIIASMMPSFPLGNLRSKIFTIIFILFSQIQMQFQQKHVFTPIIYMMIVISNLRPQNIPLQHEQTARLSRNCFLTLLLCFIVTFGIEILTKPKQNYEIPKPTFLYIFSMYAQAVVEMFIIFHAFSCVFWINRIRTFFWWLISLIVIVNALTLKNPTFFSQNSQFFSLLLPSIFSQNCSYRSLLTMLLMTPICQFMDHFNKIKFCGLMVMVLIAIFGAYSDLFSLIISSIWILLWFIVSTFQDGSFIFFSRRRLSYAQIRNLEI